jgi:hypothetical protein
MSKPAEISREDLQLSPVVVHLNHGKTIQNTRQQQGKHQRFEMHLHLPAAEELNS